MLHHFIPWHFIALETHFTSLLIKNPTVKGLTQLT